MVYTHSVDPNSLLPCPGCFQDKLRGLSRKIFVLGWGGWVYGLLFTVGAFRGLRLKVYGFEFVSGVSPDKPFRCKETGSVREK